MGRYKEKLEKRKLQEISKDIKRIRYKYNNCYVSRTIKEIERYYKNKKISEDVLFYRIDKLETSLLFRDSVFSTLISLGIGFIFTLSTILETNNTTSSNITSAIYPVILTLIIILFVFLFIFNIVRTFPNKDSGRIRYISKKEIEIIINKIEENSKIKIRKNSRNDRYLKRVKK